MGIKVPAGLCRGCLTKVAGKGAWCPKCRPAHKYKASACEATIENVVVKYQSKKEMRRHSELLLMQKLGVIANLRTQVRYPLEVGGKKVAVYWADFVYESDGAAVVEDAKGVRTAYYKLKARLFLALYGTPIREV